MVRLTKAQRKDRERIEAWLEKKPFQENARDKDPQIPNLHREEVLETYVPRSISEGAQFYTPKDMAEAFWTLVLSGYVELKEGMKILEPCAGIGHLLYPVRQEIEDLDLEVEAFEMDAEACLVGEKLFPTWMWWNSTPFDEYKAPRLENSFDLVVMNPPLRIKWGNDINSEWIQSGATSSEHRFLELALRALKPGGQLMVIAPYNYIDRLPKGKGVEAWFENFAELEAEFGRLPGEFKFTKILAFGFLIKRTIYEVEGRVPLPKDGELTYIPDDYEPEEEPPEEIEARADLEEHLPEEADMESEADEQLAEIEKERNMTKEEVMGISESEDPLKEFETDLIGRIGEDLTATKEKEGTEQMEISFLPPEPPIHTFQGERSIEVLMKELEPVNFAKKPDAAFLRSIETWGVRDPIVLTRSTRTGSLRLRDGRRRLQAAIELDFSTIPIKEYILENISGVALTLDSNVQRSTNPIAEYEAIVEFIDTAKEKGIAVTEQDISQATGMKVQTIRKRMKLGRLPVEIRDAVGERKVALGVAERMVSLSTYQKADLVAKLEDKGKVTGEDVYEIKQVKQKEGIEGIPSEVFDLPDFDPEHQHQFKPRRVADMGYRCSCGRILSQDEAINILNIYLD